MSEQAGIRRVTRSTSDRVVGGVAGGLAEHLGVPAWTLRAAFVVTSLAWGIGLVAYALMWVFLPLAGSAVLPGQVAARQPGSGVGPVPGSGVGPVPGAGVGPVPGSGVGPVPGGVAAAPPGAPAAHESRMVAGGVPAAGDWDLTGVLGILALVIGLLLALAALGLPVRASQWVPLLLVGGGVALLWRQSDDMQRSAIRARAEAGVHATASIGDRQAWVRLVVGLALLAAGVVAVLGPRIDLATGLRSMAATGAVLAGVVIIGLPWISAWLTGLQAQRITAIRNEERAAMAARVHDSVLQTLALIQRRADDPREVARLARAQERALRSWLYAPAGPPGTLAAALAEAVAGTEADFGVRIDLVTVGDVVAEGRVAALVAATREALVNVAKHADAPATVYAEVADGQVEVFVRDRGRGFDPAGVAADRHGVRESIVARMAGVGGRAVIRSAPGEGTEVRLTMPLGSPDDQAD